MNATYTVKQVAEILGYSTNSIYTFLKEKRIKGVRVGRGRFRIPQAEVERLLNIKRSGKGEIRAETSLTPEDTRPIAVSASPSGLLLPNEHVVYHEPHAAIHIMVPSLFDWFVCTVSIVYGCSLFLFSRINIQQALEPYGPWLIALRMGLIFGAFGLLYSSIRGVKETFWHNVFLSILGISFGILTIMAFTAGDYDGIVIFGTLTVVIFSHYLANLRSVISFTLYVAIISIGLPITYFFSPRWSQLTAGWDSMLVSPVLSGGILMSVLLLYVVLLVWGYRRQRLLFWSLLMVSAVAFVCVALTFAIQLSWGRAFIFIIIALTTIFVPVWESMQFTQRRDRTEIFALFISILGLFIATIFIVGSVQNIAFDYAGKQLESKVAYGGILVETSIENAQGTVERLAQNPKLIDALAVGDLGGITNSIREFYEAGTQLRRFVVLSMTGEALAVYPFDTQIEGQNFASREYFKEVMQTKRLYITDVFMAVTGVPTVLFVTPVLSAKGETKGVVLGAFDLDRLGDRLQQLADPRSGEYFVLVDRVGNRVIHPNAQLVNVPIAQKSGIRKGMLGYHGSLIEYESDGAQIIQAYDGIGGTSWGMGLSAPVLTILKPTKTGIIVMIVLACITSAMVIGYIAYRRPRVVIPIDSS